MSQESSIDVPVETPDYLIGVGGSGSGIVERLMQREWIIESEMNPDIGDDVGELHARTIDSANSERERDRRNIAEEEIQGLIQDKVDEHERREYEVDYEHYNYVENTKGGILTLDGLTSTYDINETLRNAKRIGNSWWLEDSGELIGAGGFGNGVQRRRALSKALYHLSSVHSEGEKTHPQEYNVGNNDQVVMVVALGGGTGSGSFIDIAQDMSEDADVHLFGVMPDSGAVSGRTETEDELMSAYAALSEIEYMQVNDESPFSSVVVLPYNQTTESNHFEEALVDTILSYVEVLETDNAQTRMVPGNENAINSYFSFIVAIPRIFHYDAGIRRIAEESIEDYLNRRFEQLQVENRFYKVVEHYLENNFGDSFGRSLNADNVNAPEFNLAEEAQGRDLLAMANRLEEDLQGTLLTDEALKIVEVPIDEILDQVREQYGNLGIELEAESRDAPPYELVSRERDEQHAKEIVNSLPENIRDHLRSTENATDLENQLIEIIHKEAENIAARRDLLKTIYDTDLDKIEGVNLPNGKKIKTSLTKVALDSNTPSLTTEFPQDDIQNLKDEVGRELFQDEIYYVQLSEFKHAVSDHYRTMISDWWGENSQEFEIIANYKQNRKEIEALINDLNAACEKIETQVSDDTFDADSMLAELPKVDDSIVDIQRLNELLGSVGVDEQVNRGDIEDDIKLLIQAKSAKEDYGGIWPFGDNDEAEARYRTAFTDLSDSDHFELENSQPDRAFAARFTNDFNYLLTLVDERYETTIQEIVDDMEERVTESNGELDRITVDEMVDEEQVLKELERQGTMSNPIQFLDEVGTVGLTVPEGTRTVMDSVKKLEDEIKTIEAGPDTTITRATLKNSLGINDIVETIDAFNLDDIDNNGQLYSLLEAYIVPVDHEMDDLRESLGVHGSKYVDDRNSGTFQALQRLIYLCNSLADGQNGDYEGITLSTPPDISPGNMVHGPDFYEEYKDDHIIPNAERESTQNETIYKEFIEAETRDLVGDPQDIGESHVWGNRKNDDYIPEFRKALKDLNNQDTSRVPLDIQRMGPEDTDQFGSDFEQIRLVNTYMSRIFDEEDAEGVEPKWFDGVDKIVQNELKSIIHDTNGYAAKAINYGNEWTITMTTFVSAVSSGMLEPAREKYKDVYLNRQKSTTYPWRNHSLGIEGDWDGWLQLDSMVTETLSKDLDWYPNGGAYLWRDEIRPNELAEWSIKVENQNWEDVKTDTVREKINELIKVDTFESTIDIDE